MNGYYSNSTLQYKPSGFFEYLLYQNFIIQSVNIEGLQDVSKTWGERWAGLTFVISQVHFFIKTVYK